MTVNLYKNIRDLSDLIYDNLIKQYMKDNITKNNFYKSQHIILPLFFIEKLNENEKEKLKKKLFENKKVKELFGSISDKYKDNLKSKNCFFEFMI